MSAQTFWLREETKQNEFRRPIVPADCEKLLSKGHKIFVEDWKQSIISTQAYKNVGCEIVPAGSWVNAPNETIVVGLKHLPDTIPTYKHRHIYFAHVYKEQEGWKEVMSKFKSGGGKIIDLEFMTDENGRRVSAFGYWAGYVGAALGALVCNLKADSDGLDELSQRKFFKNKDLLLEFIKDNTELTNREAIVIGSMGRSGSGAVDCLKSLNWRVIGWDKLDTQIGGPFQELLNYDLFVNCVLAFGQTPPFITQDLLNENRNLKVISDVSCDPDSDCNMVPLYSEATTLERPCHEISTSTGPLKLIAIDNLPSILPYESSLDFSSQLTPHLLDYNEEGVVKKNSLDWYSKVLAKI